MEFLLQNFRQISNTLTSSANDHSWLRGVYYDSRSDGALCQLYVAVPGAFQFQREVLIYFESSRNIFDKIFRN